MGVAVSATNTNGRSLTSYYPKSELLKQVRELPDVWRVKTPTLNSLVRDYGEGKALATIKMWIISLNDAINVTRGMTPAQIDDAAEVILGEFPYLTIADIRYVFQRGKTNAYGELYGSMDVTVISKWFRTHWDERLQAAEGESVREHERTKEKDNHPRGVELSLEKHREMALRYLQEKAGG